jgi:modulator of FtsH protease
LWQNLYIMLGGAAGALAGLLFIAMSLQIRAIAKDSVLRARASANTFMIVMLVINAGAILVPQSNIALGVELCLTALLYVPFFIWRTLRVKRITKAIPKRAFVSFFYPITGILGGVSLIFQFGGGMYIVTIQSAAILAWVIFNAWSIMLAATAEDIGATA